MKRNPLIVSAIVLSLTLYFSWGFLNRGYREEFVFYGTGKDYTTPWTLYIY